MKNEVLARPVITEFMGDGFALDKAHKQYLENLELWNYIQALDKYCDELEKLRGGECSNEGGGLNLPDVRKRFINWGDFFIGVMFGVFGMLILLAKLL